MDTDKLAVALTAAAMSGITVLAYKHPDAYRKLCIPIIIVLTLFLAGVAVWNIAIAHAFYAVDPYIRLDKLKDADNAARGLRIGDWLFFAVMGLELYLGFLLALPLLISKTKTDDHDSEK